MRLKWHGVLFLTTIGVAVVTVQSSEAIPSFARRYKTECTTCHTVFPARSEFGDAFYKNGFIWPDNASPSKKASVTESSIDGTITDGLLLNTIPANIPISFLGENEASYNSKRPDKSPGVKNNRQIELFNDNAFEMFAAGSIANKVAFFAEYSFTEQETGEIYAEVHHPLNLPLAIKAGRFKPKLSLWKSNDRTTISSFNYINKPTGKSSFKLNDEDGGVEISSTISDKVYLAAGVMNSKDRERNGKNGYGHLSLRLAGTDFLGHEPEVDLDKDSIFDYLTLTVGGFGYVGSNDIGTSPNTVPNDFYRAGLETEIGYKMIHLQLAGTYGQDDNAHNNGITDKTRTATALLSLFPLTGLVASTRYEYFSAERNIERIVRRIAPAVAWAPIQNVKLSLEYHYDRITRSTDGIEINREALFQIAYSF